MRFLVAFLILLLPLCSSASSWAVKKLSPGGYISYSWSNTNDDTDTPHLDVRTCHALSIGYEDDINGANVAAASNVYLCPFNDSAVGVCVSLVNKTADSTGTTHTARPGWLFLDVTATGAAAATARLTVFCARSLAP
jgi:hypothetical protein